MRAVFIIGWGLLCGSIVAYPLLKRSPFLKQKGLELATAIGHQDKVTLYPRSPHLKNAPLFLLTNSGKLVALDKSKWQETKKQPTGCGDQIKPAQAKVDGKTVQGTLVLSGKSVSNIRWTPAKASPSAKLPDCARYQKGYAKMFSSITKVDSISGTFFFAEWKKKGLKKKQCESDAFVGVTGVLGSRAVKCLQLNMNYRDCNFQSPPFQRSLRELIGHLKLGEEHWLIFKSQGAEAWGYTAIQFDTLQSMNVIQSESLHPWGC